MESGYRRAMQLALMSERFQELSCKNFSIANSVDFTPI
jgi:hypothetical protein